ncbi:non-specific lipid-transfer protein 2-like [Malania oleifera]|uniref:non-specific lipid-transfer protein 2-like n=1 Tax=Malania oleifera TaxID=397392 RepID=UPI0025ADC1BF|nr:non-specific lipid-transfer protein 2-like [Malania oleifera]
MKISLVAVVCAVVVLMLMGEAQVTRAASCNPVQLSPCLGAITSSAKPSGLCCARLKEQQPCLCGYLKNPSLKQYVNSPNAKRVAATCHVPSPSC